MYTKLNIKPLYDRVIIESVLVENKTTTGIIIPDSAKVRPQEGIIVAIGPGKKNQNMLVKVGDKVLYSKYSGTEIIYNNKEYLIMKESDILAII